MAALGLVAIGAGNGIGGELRRGGMRPGDWALLAIGAAVAVVVITAVVATRPQSAPSASTAGEHRMRPPILLPVVPHLVSLVILVILAVLIGFLPDEDALRSERLGPLDLEEEPGGLEAEEPSAVNEGDGGRRESGEGFGGLDLRLLSLAAALAAVAAVVLVRAARAPASAGGVGPPTGTALAEALDASLADLDDLAADPDHRRVVIRAYARMERALAVEGVARDPAEAPFEYLARSLSTLGVAADDAHRLTELFERARYSRAPIGAEVRQEALLAVDAVRREAARP